MAQLTSFNGRLVKDFVKNPKAIRMPSGPLSADIILPGYPPYGLCSDPAVRFDHWHRDPLYNHYMRLGLVALKISCMRPCHWMIFLSFEVMALYQLTSK
jgi:hypothetical protein